MAFVKNYVQPLTARLFDRIYRHYFEVIRADTPELLEQVYTLRYQVYADEHGFENPDEFPTSARWTNMTPIPNISCCATGARKSASEPRGRSCPSRTIR